MRKFNKIFGVGLSLALLISLVVSALPISAATLSISAETDIPSTTNYMIAPAGTDVAGMAVNGNTIYVTTGTSASNQTFKSTDGGKTWSVISTGTDYPSTTTISTSSVAVASDNANVLAVLGSDNRIYYSSDGGSSWSNLGAIPNVGTINAIAISPAVSGVYYVAAAGSTNASVGELWILKLSLAQGWIQASSANGSATTDNMTANQTGMYAVAFSPNFGTDKIILVVSSNASSTYLQAFRDESGAFTWNGAITFFGAADWASGSLLDSVAATGASIAMPSNFVGTQSGSRVAFISVRTAGNTGGIYRNTDSFTKKFTTWSGGPTGAMYSVGYTDAGKVVAGDVDSNTVLRSLAPFDTDPKFDRTPNFKQPGGAGNVSVTYSGTTVVAGTQGDESAVATSTDDGLTFNDISLIDTALTAWTDTGVSADGATKYLASADTASGGTQDVSFWVKSGTWQRSFLLMNQTSATAGFLIRLAPEDPNTVYINQAATNKMWMTNNQGLSSWTDVTVYKLSAIKDFAVQSASVVYAIDASGFSKTTNGGSTWADKVPLSGTAGFMMTIAPNNDILVGGSDGSVAFSKDSGATFTQTKSAGSGNNYVTYDKDYATNNIIYAANGAAVKRGKADTTTDWASRSPDIDFTSNFVPGGMLQTNGIVYVLYNSNNSTESRVYRALSLTAATTSATAYWSYLASTAFNSTGIPTGFKISVSSNIPKVWITAVTKGPYSFTDNVALIAPTQKAPTPGQIIQVNPGSGNPYNVTFSFSRYASEKITRMELQVATDSAFNGVIGDVLITPSADPTGDTVAVVLGPTTTPAVSFNPGTTYYWRVRVAQTGPMYSPWSSSGSFKIENPIPFTIISPASGANDVPVNTSFVWNPFPSATTYVWAISTDSTFASADTVQIRTANTFYQPTTPLKNSTTYYWRVKAITADNVETPWVNGIFSTEAVPPTTPPPTTPVQPTFTITVPPPIAPIPTVVLWAIVGIGAILIIALIVLIVRTRRVA